MRYIFLRPYNSAAGMFGKGQIVDMPEDLAAWFNRDDPDCLAPYVPENVSVTEARIAEPAENRMVTKSKRRKAAKGQ